ncbi:hypothetical protein [Gracilibacillus suaedae]|uniref:hypothetical protein n=1 Tax=Gracilibacillus suaedae TaxID=2820273 RepID=UPI001ABDA202|nr:hypothetical protein [Gracilibacillus suaedae]
MSHFVKVSIMVVTFLLITAPTAFAQSSSFDENELKDLENEINEILVEELENYSAGIVEYENPSIKLTQVTLEKYNYNKQDILNAFKKEAELIKANAKNITMEFEEKETDNNPESEIGIQKIIKNPSHYPGDYTASVSAAVPGLTTASIRQDFDASVRSGYIKSITLRGSSYSSSKIGLSQWSPIKSWATIETVGAYQGLSASIRMKGTLSYIFKGSPISLTPTFKKTFTPHDL